MLHIDLKPEGRNAFENNGNDLFFGDVNSAKVVDLTRSTKSCCRTGIDALGENDGRLTFRVVVGVSQFEEFVGVLSGFLSIKSNRGFGERGGDVPLSNTLLALVWFGRFFITDTELRVSCDMVSNRRQGFSEIQLYLPVKESSTDASSPSQTSFFTQRSCFSSLLTRLSSDNTMVGRCIQKTSNLSAVSSMVPGQVLS